MSADGAKRFLVSAFLDDIAATICQPTQLRRSAVGETPFATMLPLRIPQTDTASHSLMSMLMMHSWKMRMRVNRRFMPVVVRVFNAGWHRFAMLMLMVFVMHMFVRMLKRLMNMFVLMVFSQMQPNA
jgi:hypothetical protein